jgi:tripartite ATP-independent transporter DctM subunit
LSELIKLLVDAARTTSTVMFLCAGALVSSYMVTLADLPSQVVDMLAPMMGDPRVLMAAVMLLLLAVGTVMDLTPTILVMGPVLMPIALKAGIDPTYFGVMFVMVGTLGLIHPPVCTVLNVVCGVAKISLESATKGIWPFLLTYIVLITLFIIFPGIITMPMTWFR